MAPRHVAAHFGLSSRCGGGALIIISYWRERVALDRWSLRGLIFILGAMSPLVAVRPLGLAGGAIGLDYFRRRQFGSRFAEIAIFGLVMLGFVFFFFKILLGLPIPVATVVTGVLIHGKHVL